MADNLPFQVRDLSAAATDCEVGDMSASLQFDHTKYSDYDFVVDCLNNLPNRKKRVSRKTLGVNGRVVADAMPTYLANPATSSSALKEVLKTPRHYLIYQDPRLKKEKNHFTLGTFCHSAFLEPRKFDLARVEPDYALNTKEGIANMIEWYQEELALPASDLRDVSMVALREMLASLKQKFTEAGMIAVSADHKQIIEVIRRAYKIYGGGILPKLLRLADSEVSFYANDPDTGLKVKVRPDGLLLEENAGFNAVISLKTTSAETLDQFARDATKYRYDLSEGMYLDVISHVTGRKFTATIMVVLQTVHPYQVMMLYWSPEDLESGRYKYHQAINTLAECKRNNNYPSFDSFAEEGAKGLIRFELPAYARLALKEQQANE